jgi:EAL domain-containing protein (putative c-di-GMP-specific phosphodiesterase class I)
VDPSRIIFEITESEVIANVAKAVETMAHLRDLGFRFALDDFGAGTSSLNYLKMLPIDMIKVDGTFVKNLDTEPFNLAVVKAVRALAEALKVPLVAEYVEKQAVFDVLTDLGVEYAQGYLLGPPRTKPYADSELFGG